MKNALFLIVQFVVHLFALALNAGAVCYLYFQCTRVVPGAPAAFLSVRVILPYIPVILALSAIVSGFMIQGMASYRKMRAFPQIVSALLVMGVWLGVIPLCAALDSALAGLREPLPPPERVSPGYFRPLGNGVFFLTSPGDPSGGIFLRTSEAAGEPVVLRSVDSGNLRRPPFSDVLVADSMEIPPFMSALGKEILFFHQIGERAWRGGRRSWLIFASICLPLAAISALSRMGSWSLKNAVIMVGVFFCVVWLNKLFLQRVLGSMLASGGPDPFGLENGAASGVLLAAWNLILALTITITGIVCTVLTSREKNGEAGEP